MKSVLMSVCAICLLTGCTAKQNTGVTDLACIAFQPIDWSQKDTNDTVRQIREHNVVWETLCDRTD